MPLGLINAPFEPTDRFVMRVGIPHRGGSLAFHAFNEEYPAMVSASAFWSARSGAFCIPRATNLYEVDFALDSAGFTAMRLWKSKGKQPGMAGVFPWTYAQYVELACSVGASWWAQPDLCCEPEIAGSEDEVDYRIRATATLLEGVLRIVYAWQNELAKTSTPGVVANLAPPPVPVIQGWTADHYLRSLDLLLQVWHRWKPWLAAPALIGVGSVCRRHLHHPNHGLLAVLGRLEGALPSGSRLHLFGVKGASLEHLKMREWIASADSMAYDDGARRQAWAQGHSNTVDHRSRAMSRWVRSASDRLLPAKGDQFLLRFA
ncbi:hypothetical protein CDN99_15705 [Roseateles aquatilis]|uniref:DeoxyPurine in DNA protein A domain-containing protein n=2 Tax=Roseateles aquatilis TaxID=431061 RepID=A0A246J8X2_9BURK|nr:hypothetical protein [Burkholderiaceae bacterium]OWQ88980.1 hypothetical protein CDN99_15705 [Roseateles aquatilis]